MSPAPPTLTLDATTVAPINSLRDVVLGKQQQKRRQQLSEGITSISAGTAMPSDVDMTQRK